MTGRTPIALLSSPKYTQPLRDVPQTIEAIPREVMEAQGVTTLSEAMRNVPGITLQAGEGGGASSTAGDMFNIRGFNAANSLFVDGVRDDGLISRDVFNLEQIDVFMGPTGSDVGRSTAAGYVNMETKTPHLPSGILLANDLRERRSEAPDGRCGPQARPRAAGKLGQQDGGSPQRDVAGQRRTRTRRGRPEQPRHRAVDCFRVGDADACHGGSADRAPGQRVRDDGERTLLFDLDAAIQRLGHDVPDNSTAVQLTAVYHNLLRRWADL